jgi:hypothetical protein
VGNQSDTVKCGMMACGVCRSLDEMVRSERAAKTKKLQAVSSPRTRLRGHTDRLDAVKGLGNRLLRALHEVGDRQALRSARCGAAAVVQEVGDRQAARSARCGAAAVVPPWQVTGPPALGCLGRKLGM